MRATCIELSEIGYRADALFGKNVLGKQGITKIQDYELISTAINHGVEILRHWNQLCICRREMVLLIFWII